MENEARIAEKTKTTERQLWRENSRELSTDLQWLGLSTELKTVSFQILRYGVYKNMYILKITGFGS